MLCQNRNLSLQKFKNAERGTDIVRSVALLHERSGEPTPFPHSFEQPAYPIRTEITAPRNPFVKKWSRATGRMHGLTTSESPVAELSVFKNAKVAGKLEVSVWTVEQTKSGAPASLYYAFQLMPQGQTDHQNAAILRPT